MNVKTTQVDNNNKNTKITFSSLTISNKELPIMDKGFLKIASIQIRVVKKDSFSHIGSSYYPLATVKDIVGKNPVIPATTKITELRRLKSIYTGRVGVEIG